MNEKTIKNVFKKIKSFTYSFTSRNRKQINSRLDALLIEKVREEGLELQLNKKFSPLKIIAALLSGGALLFSLIMFVAFVPGPWTRFFANPEAVTIALGGVEYTENGVVTTGQKFVLASPKAIRGVQYIKQNFSITPHVEHKLSLSEDKTQIIVETTEELQAGEVYTFTLEPGVLFDDSSYLVNEQSWLIPTKAKFDLVSISPRNGVTAGIDSTVQITFTTDEFELFDVIKHISIFPEIDGVFSKVSSRVIFVPTKQLSVGGTYTVSVSKDLVDSDGATLSENHYSTFTVVSDNAEIVSVPYMYSRQVFNNHSQGNESIIFYTDHIKSVKAQLYKVTWEEVKPYVDNYVNGKGAFNASILLADKTAVRSLNSSVKSKYDQYITYSMDLSGEKDGIYIVKLYDVANPSISLYLMSFKSEFGVYGTVRKDPTDIDLWAFNYKTLQHEAGVNLDVVGCKDSICTSRTGFTPENGHVQVKTDHNIMYTYAYKGEGAVMLQSDAHRDPYGNFRYTQSDLFTKIILNKPSFLPGDQLKYSVIIRDRNDAGDYVYPKVGETFTVALCKNSSWGSMGASRSKIDASNCISTQSVSISSDGQLDGSFDLWDRSENLLFWVIQENNEIDTIIATDLVEIYEADKPQVQLSIRSDKTRYQGVDTVNLSGRVTNYVDAGLSNKALDLSIYFNSANGNSEIASEILNLTTDEYGNFSYSYKLPSTSAQEYEYRVVFNATYHDGENYISRNTIVDWDRGDTVQTAILVNGEETEYVGIEEKAKLVIKSVTLPGEEALKKEIKIKISRIYSIEIKGAAYYDEKTRKTIVPISYTSRTEEILSKDVSISSSGEYAMDMPNIKEGRYEMQITESGSYPWNINETRTIFYSNSSSYGSLSTINEWVQQIAFSKNRVNVGDKAALNIAGNFASKSATDLLLLIKTGEVSSWRYIDANTQSLEIPITKEMQGGLEVCVVHPMKTYIFTSDNITPLYKGSALHTSCSAVAVENTNKKLAIKLDPASLKVNPGSPSELKIKVSDSGENGIAAAVGVNVVDKAVYDEYFSGRDYRTEILDLYKEIYTKYTAHSASGMLSSNALYLMDGIGGRGAGGGGETVLRKDFNDNPMWSAALHSNTNGDLSVQIPYSDAITTWVVLVWSITEDLRVGTEVVEVTTQRDVFVEVDSPKTLRKGDTWKPYVRVVNTKNEPFAGTVAVSCNGCLAEALSQSISIPALETRDIVLNSTITKEGELPFYAKLTQNGKIIDEIEIGITVRPVGFTIPLAVSSLVSSDSDKIKFVIPEKTILSGSDLNLVLSQYPLIQMPSVSDESGSTVDLAEAIIALSQISQYNLYERVGVDKKGIDSRIQLYSSALFNRMLSDGSFPFNASGGTDYDATIAAGYAIAYIKNTGAAVTIPVEIEEQNILYLTGLILSDEIEFEEKSKVASALAFIQQEDAARAVMSLYQTSLTVENLSSDSKSFMALALQQIGATADSGHLLKEIASEYTITSEGGTKYIEGKQVDMLTMIQVFLIKNLGMESIYKTDLSSFQAWVDNRCTSCSESFEQELASSLYLAVFMDHTQTQDTAGDMNISINGGKVETVKYNGNTLSYNLPASLLKIGTNTIQVKTALNKSLFTSVRGNIYVSDIVGSGTIKPQIHILGGINHTHTFNVGRSGHYVVSIVAEKDTPSGLINISLPSGLQYKSQWLPQYSNKTEKYLYAYGDIKRSNVIYATLPSLKKGEVIYVIAPFTAVREGVFNGASIYMSFAGSTDIQAVQDSKVTIK